MRLKITVDGIGSGFGMGVVERVLSRASRLRTVRRLTPRALSLERSFEEEDSVSGSRRRDGE